MRKFTKFAVGLLVFASSPALTVRADPVLYSTPGVENPVTYTFTAAADGEVFAYFAGSSAAFENTLGMKVNGGAVGTLGLDNHTSALGTRLDLGPVHAGNTLVFEMHNVYPGIGDLFSDPSLNAAYDGDNLAHNHIYSANYAGTNPAFMSAGIPAGTYVAFEDLPVVNSPYFNDWNYNDEDFVFTNVMLTSSTPLPAAPLGGAVLLSALWMTRRVLRARAIA